jgi:hypothetical protein
MLGSGSLQPAMNAAVLRRGGLLRVLLRHGFPRTQRGNPTSPEPCKWFTAGLEHHSPSSVLDSFAGVAACRAVERT